MLQVAVILKFDKMIKSSNGRNLKRPESLNDSENNLIIKCRNEICTFKGNLQVFRHCARYSAFFCNQCCDFSEKVIKLLNERSDNYWLKPLYALSLLKKILKKMLNIF